MRQRRSKLGEIVIEVTPLVDVIFLLLLFFILTTTFTVEEQSINVELPKALSGTKGMNTDTIVIFIDSKDKVVIDGKGVSLDNIEGVLSKLKEKHKFSKAIIKADESSHHGVVVSVMDALRLVGIYDIKLAVEER